MAKQPLVLILHDTTEMDFTSHTALEGSGPIGDGDGRGFLQHNSLAVLPTPRQVEALPDDTRPPDCDGACVSYCNAAGLQNPVNRGMCRSLWGVGLNHRPIEHAEACRRLGALVRAAGIAGAATWLLDASAAYAGDRVQFGKPIGRQQALQQQLAVMAEQVTAARMAVELGCAGGMPLTLAPAATAKIVTSIAAPQVAAIAHAVHGAIGISAEHDLQLYTRRLHGWRVDHGAESYWEHRLGAERIRGGAERSVDWIREAFP
jgi:hypothetical protein